MAARTCLLDLNSYIVILCRRGEERKALASFSEGCRRVFYVEKVVELESAVNPEDRHWGYHPKMRTAYYLSSDGGKTFPFCFRRFSEIEARDVLQGWVDRGRKRWVFRFSP